MDSPNPDSGEEYYHTNTQLYGVLDESNRFKLGEAVTAPWNAPPPGAVPTMDGFVADYISTFTGEMGRQPTYEEYAHIMTGCTPEQLPVLNGIARDFGVFDHPVMRTVCGQHCGRLVDKWITGGKARAHHRLRANRLRAETGCSRLAWC